MVFADEQDGRIGKVPPEELLEILFYEKGPGCRELYLLWRQLDPFNSNTHGKARSMMHNLTVTQMKDFAERAGKTSIAVLQYVTDVEDPWDMYQWKELSEETKEIFSVYAIKNAKDFMRAEDGFFLNSTVKSLVYRRMKEGSVVFVPEPPPWKPEPPGAKEGFTPC
jgi:hypothetical protein